MRFVHEVVSAAAAVYLAKSVHALSDSELGKSLGSAAFDNFKCSPT